MFLFPTWRPFHPSEPFPLQPLTLPDILTGWVFLVVVGLAESQPYVFWWFGSQTAKVVGVAVGANTQQIVWWHERQTTTMLLLRLWIQTTTNVKPTKYMCCSCEANKPPQT